MPVPKPFEYYASKSVEEALELLDKFKEDAKVIAGGQSLVPLMKFRIVAPKALIDIYKNLRGQMSYIKRSGPNEITIGALATHYEIVTSKLLNESCPILPRAAKRIGDFQVRNRGTIGGSLCHADPVAHYPPAIVALDAKLIAKSLTGERVIRAREFFKDVLTTDLRPNEILTEIRVPVLNERYRWGYESIERRGGDYPSAIAATVLKLKEDGTCEDAKIVLGAVATTPIEMDKAERALIGRKVDEEVINEVADKVYEELENPVGDIKASAEYKRELAKELTRRALLSAIGGG